MTKLTARELRAQKAARKPAREEQIERAQALGEEDVKARHEAATALAEQAAAVAADSLEETDLVPSVGAQVVAGFGDFLDRVKELGLRGALLHAGVDPAEIGVDFAAPGADQTVFLASNESHLAEQDKYNTPAAKEARRHAERLARIARGEEQP